ncbi:MAG: hypothetical protein ABIH24_03600 [Verrucomicrobiota bacterium]
MIAAPNVHCTNTTPDHQAAPSSALTPETVSATAAIQVVGVTSNSHVPLIVASTNCWFAATNWSQRLDWFHDTVNATINQNIQYADYWFIDDPANRVPFEPPKFRLGLQIEADYFAHTNKFALKPLADTECEVHMLNAEKRFRLTISTLDPMALPGQDSNQGISGFRVGLKKWLFKHIDTSFGVRLKWLPSIYANIAWEPRYKLDAWDIYPEQKAGWESDDGIYEISSLMLNRWVNRWVIRPVASLKLSRDRYKRDMDQLDQERQAAEAAGLPPPDGNYLKGWDWELTLLSGYAHELFDETVYGRLADGSDVARGGGFRFSVLGSLHIVESYNLTFLYRGHLYKQWLYYLIKPGISWQHENDWAADYSLSIGFDILLYGTKER